MAKPTVRQAPDDGSRAPRHDQCAEDEVRQVAVQPTCPQGRGELDSPLIKVGRQAQLTEKEAAVLASVRDRSPARTVDFD